MSDRRPLTCDEVDDLTGVYVLGALEPDEADAVWHHLATCDGAHEEFRELAPTGAVLATTVEPVDAPPEMRDRVLEAIARTPQDPDPTVSRPADELPAEPATVAPLADAAGPSGRSWWQRWAERGDRDRPPSLALTGFAAAVIVVLVVAVGAVFVLPDDDDAGRLALLRRAVAAASDPDATVALLAGSDAATGASGYAVFEGDDGFIVVDGLPSTEPGDAYQAWLIGAGDPVSAGLLEVTPDGLGTLTGIERLPGTGVVALSVEERPGAEAPTTTPVVLGEIRTASS